MREVQTSFDELYPAAVHDRWPVVALEFGYRGRCSCGWVGPELASRRLAQGSVSSHLARTAPGRRVVALLRKP